MFKDRRNCSAEHRVCGECRDIYRPGKQKPDAFFVRRVADLRIEQTEG